MAQALNPGTREAEAHGSLSSRPAHMHSKLQGSRGYTETGGEGQGCQACYKAGKKGRPRAEAKGIVPPPPPPRALWLVFPKVKLDSPSEMQPHLRAKEDQPEHKGCRVRVLTMCPSPFRAQIPSLLLSGLS